ncbi:sialic acid-binding Ig-like lectin 16 [Tenrec ecaudatus]|uniref:sialic acid-binding Ig-like lectin 16 n=1 Tax=Tenrec ecaudatus TaxID=94439 RepID=UPI003F5A605C
MSLLLLLLALLRGAECVGGPGVQAGAGADTWPGLYQRAQSLRKKYQLKVQSSVKVQEGLCIFIPCNFSYAQEGWTDRDPAYGFWYREDAKKLMATNNLSASIYSDAQGRFQLLRDPRNGSCSLVIIDARSTDKAKYYFRVERGSIAKYDYKDYKMSLEVTGLTQKPNISVPETLEPGRPAKLLCLFPGDFEGCPTPTFSWTGSALSSQGPKPQTSLFFSELTLTPKPQDHNTELTCRVEFNKGVSAERTIQLKVDHAPKDAVISVSQTNASAPQPQGDSVEVHKGQYLRLRCEADGQPPAMLSWVLDNRVLSMSSPTQSGPLELELPRVGARDAGRYTCQAENRLGSQQSWLNLSVQYPPENLRVTISQANRTVLENFGNGSSFPVLEGQSLRLVCVADSSPPASLSWVRGSRALSPSAASGPGLLELPRVREEDGGEVTCRAENPLGVQQVSLHLSVLGKAGTLDTASTEGCLQGVALGVGLATVILLGPCLIFFVVKTCRKKTTKMAGPDVPSVIGTVAQAVQKESGPGKSVPAETTPPSGEDQELHYASLVFHGHRPRKRPRKEPPTEYSEIRKGFLPTDRPQLRHTSPLDFADGRVSVTTERSSTSGSENPSNAFGESSSDCHATQSGHSVGPAPSRTSRRALRWGSKCRTREAIRRRPRRLLGNRVPARPRRRLSRGSRGEARGTGSGCEAPADASEEARL